MLPKINPNLVPLTIPSTKESVKFRSLIAKDDKTLKTAILSNDYLQILVALRKILNDAAGKQLKLAIFDVDYLYAHLYGATEKKPLQVRYRDNEDNESRQFDVDLQKVEIKWPDEDLRTIHVNDKIKLLFTYPSADLLDDPKVKDMTPLEIVDFYASSCLDKIYDGDKTYDVKLEKSEDIKAWLLELPISAHNDIQKFVNNIPSIHYEISYTNNNGTERKITLRSLNDIFNWI